MKLIAALECATTDGPKILSSIETNARLYFKFNSSLSYHELSIDR